jgi:Squalene-hopene cyclase C-terminal domain
VKPAVRSRIASSIADAKRYLIEQATGGFPEVRHVMTFPRRAGFSAETETQSTDVFPRAVLASVLLDAAELDEDGVFRDAVRAIARREAEHVATARLRRREGGWSYFAGLPELPPDLDSLSAALLLFTRAAPELAPLCSGPIALALGRAGPDGAIETWLISAADDPGDREVMERGVALFWGSGADVDVCAHFYLALWTHDPARYGETARLGARWVQTKQRTDGTWEAAWYHGNAYPAALCLRLLRAVGGSEEAIARGIEHLRTTERSEGGWGSREADPQETALALWAIACGDGDGEVAAAAATSGRAVDSLLESQLSEGGWKPSPWIRMDAGRAQGGRGPVLSYGSATLTSAFCLRTLLLARRRAIEP